MLHRRMPFLHDFHVLFFLAACLIISCKTDTSTHSEDESAYMADYESPADHWGFIDMEGNLVIKSEFDDVAAFSEGLAAVNKNGKWGFINKAGTIVIEPIYKSAWSFHEGFARVSSFDQPDQFINKAGKSIPAKDWSAADDFSGGRARVQVGNGFGFIDSTGALVIPPIFTRGWNFINGMVVVEYHEKLGVVDESGEYILQPEYDHVKIAGEGKIILARKGEDSWAFDPGGKELLAMPKAKFVESDGNLLSVRKGDQMELVTIADGKSVTPLFLNIIYLDHQLWAAKKDIGYQLLDRDGKVVSDHQYNQVNKFSDGFAAYSKDDYWGYLDASGKELTGEVFGLAWDYKEGFARAAFKDGLAFIDRQQKLAFYPPAGTLDFRDFSEGLAAVQMD